MKHFIRQNRMLLFALAIILLGIWLYTDLKPKHADSMEDLYYQVTQMVLKQQGYRKYELAFAPDGFNFNELAQRVSRQDPYLSANIGASNCIWSQRGNTYQFTVSLDYNADALQLWRSDRRIRKLCRRIEHLSDYEKIKAIHDYVILYSDYGTGGRFIDDIENGPYWGLFPGHTTCNGYAMIFYRAMQFLDIPVTYETGSDHAWNSVCLDGKWYNIDLTWDDDGRRGVSYDYFLKTDAEFAGHHHGSSDADTSVPVTGRSAEENYKLFPNYKLQFWIHWALNVVILLLAIRIGKKIRQKRAAEKRQKWLDSINTSE